MSARKMRRAREIAERKRMTRAALATVKEQGCVCGPTVEITTIVDGVLGATIRHSECVRCSAPTAIGRTRTYPRVRW